MARDTASSGPSRDSVSVPNVCDCRMEIPPNAISKATPSRAASESTEPILLRSVTSTSTSRPGCSARSLASSSSCGTVRITEDTNLRVVSALGCAKSSAVVPVSTTRPESMTATRSATARTTSISWVISTIVIPSSRLTRRSRLRTSCVVSGSSADVDSSASSSSGLVASARAMPTRCFWPPESCSG